MAPKTPLTCAHCKRFIRCASDLKNGMCTQCYNSEHYKAKKQESSQSIQLAIPTVGSSSKCIFKNCFSNDLQLISKDIRNRVGAIKSCIIELHSKTCEQHIEMLNNLNFKLEELQKKSDSSLIEINSVSKVIQDLQKVAKTESSKKNKFKYKTEYQVKKEIRMSKEQFKEVKKISKLQGSRSDDSLYIYIYRMVTGISERHLSNIFSINERTIRYHLKKARTALQENFANKFLSFQSTTNEVIRSHTTEIARNLFSQTKHILVLDGTYIYVEKSGNFLFQRKSFSGHKHRNLVKFFMTVLTDGFALDVSGPFEANISDSNLLKNLIASEEFQRKFKASEVIFIVDRGFQNCIDYVKNLGYEIYMPTCKDFKEKQLSTIEANRTRLVTKVRFIVEVVNGIMKQKFSYFNKTVPNTTLPTLKEDFINCVALMNFVNNGSFISDKNDISITDRMLSLMDKENKLINLVQQEKLTATVNCRSTKFELVTELQDFSFPQLDENQLKEFFCGSYHYEIARSYYAEHVKDNGRYQFFVDRAKFHIDYSKYKIDINPEKLQLISAQMQSRHSNATKYRVFILINSEKSFASSIEYTYCTCKTGCRTIGTCAHSASFIWYLSYGRHLENIRQPAKYLDTFFQSLIPLPIREIDGSEESDDDLIETESLIDNNNQENNEINDDESASDDNESSSDDYESDNNNQMSVDDGNDDNANNMDYDS